MTREANKAVAWRFLEAMVRGEMTIMASLLHGEGRVFTAGDTRAGGWETRDEFVTRMTRVGGGAGGLFDGPMTVDIGAVTAEDDRVCIEMEVRAAVTGGGVYNNQFHWLIRVRDGLVVEAKEYMDTLHAFDRIPGVERSNRPRVSNLTEITGRMSSE